MSKELKPCPRQASDMTPCVIVDGDSARDDAGRCVGCGMRPCTDPRHAKLLAAAKAVVSSQRSVRHIDDFHGGPICNSCGADLLPCTESPIMLRNHYDSCLLVALCAAVEECER